MYIGSTDGRGLMHCLWEIIDNSVDEALAGHCDRIQVALNEATVAEKNAILEVEPDAVRAAAQAFRRAVGSAREQADLLFDPPLPGIGLRSWQSFDAAINQGYEHAQQVIEENGLDFLWTIRGHGVS